MDPNSIASIFIFLIPSNIYVAPGNPGIKSENKVHLIEVKDPKVEDYLKIAKEKNIDLTIVGPEAPLVEGIVDEFIKNNLLIFGPNKLAAQLEGSKNFCKKILNSGNIPTAKHQSRRFSKKIISFRYCSWCYIRSRHIWL